MFDLRLQTNTAATVLVVIDQRLFKQDQVLGKRRGGSSKEYSVLFRPAFREFRHDPRFLQVVKRTGVLAYWQGSGNWPDFCTEPDLPYDCMKEAAKIT